MKCILVVGHRHLCPLHGANQVESGSAGYTFNGSAVARVGDRTTCGAVIESGAEHFLIEGAAVACKGDRADHGGVLDEGDAGRFLASGSHNSDCPGFLTQTNKFSNFAAPRFPDYRPDVSLMKSVHTHPESAPSLELTGVIALMPTAGAHTIKSATLTVAYWPDKNISSARLESRVQVENA